MKGCQRIAPDWLLTPYRLAVHEPSRTAVVADLHLDYQASRRRRGDAIPFVSLEEQLTPLKRACAALDLRELVVAGDLCETRVTPDLVARLLETLVACGLTLRAVTPGNHDREWRSFTDRIPFAPEGHRLGEWLVVHGDGVPPPGPVIFGHHHPAWASRTRLDPCYLVAEQRLVLPAFSRDAAGGDVRQRLVWRNHRAFVIERGAVIDRGLLRPGDPRPRQRFWADR